MSDQTAEQDSTPIALSFEEYQDIRKRAETQSRNVRREGEWHGALRGTGLSEREQLERARVLNPYGEDFVFEAEWLDRIEANMREAEQRREQREQERLERMDIARVMTDVRAEEVAAAALKTENEARKRLGLKPVKTAGWPTFGAR